MSYSSILLQGSNYIVFLASLALASSNLIACRSAQASDGYEFDPSLLQGGVSAFELTKFSRANAVMPGTYLLDIVVNNISVERADILFRAQPGKNDAVPCLTVEVLNRIGVDLSKLPSTELKKREGCVDLGANIPFSSVSVDGGEQRLLISVPQANMRRRVKGYIDPSHWDRGLTAGMFNYSYNSFYSSTQKNGTQNYLGLNSGLNLENWRIRYNSALSWNSINRAWQNRSLYAQRNLQSLSSQLTIGDSSTSGNIFDSFSLRGMQITSDERMLPDSLSGYAPVVRGQANTNAKVTIRQNGYTIYETSVAPGAFEIKDLYPSGYGGDLEVTVIEADGQARKFSVPYAAVARMLRPEAQRYSAAIGQYRSGFNDNNKRLVAQLTYERGLNNVFTGYTGLLAANGYYSTIIGTATNTPVGAFGFDVTHATTKLERNEGASTGKSIRLSYSKTFAQTGSSMSVAAYRYSSSGYYSLSDAMMGMGHERNRNTLRGPHFHPHKDSINSYFQGHSNGKSKQRRRRSTIQFTFNQFLSDIGAVYATGTASSYWNRPGSTMQYQVGYNGGTRYFNYSVSAIRSMDYYGINDNQLYVTFSFPLDTCTTASSSLSFNNKGLNTRGSVNGTGGVSNEYSWGVSATKDELGSKSVATYADYRGSKGTLSASVGSGDGYRQSSWGATGSVVAHPGGVTLGQPVGDTFAIIEARDAEGASISSQPGVRIDRRGFAIVPYLTPYRSNTIDIDPRNISTDVEFKSTSQELIPTAGAILLRKFETVSGRAAVIDLIIPDDVAVPFGTEVLTATGSKIGIVGQGGRAIVRGLDDNGTLIIRWGESVSQQCQIAYVLAPVVKGGKQGRFEHFSVPCEPNHPNIRVVLAQRAH